MAKKPLRDITPKGDTKLLNKDLKGVKGSTTDSPDLDAFIMDPDNMKGTKDFVKKYMKTQTHDDRVGNKEVPYRSKGKQADYPRADASMYEAAECTCDDDKHTCAVHGKKEVKEHSELSGLEAMQGAVPAGMARHAENTWKNAEQYFDKPPTQLTGEGKPFLSKMGAVKESIREIQKEAVNNLYEKLTDSAKSNIRTALTPKMKKTSGPARALIKVAKMNKANIKEDEEQLDEKNWIKGAIKHPGALHRELGVPQGEKIPASKLNAAAKEGGKIGQRARLAKTLGKMHEDAPPSKSSEEWIKKNKSRFTKEYGKDKGERVLYGKAWNDYKAKHEETQTDYTNAKNGQTKPQLTSGRNLDTGNL